MNLEVKIYGINIKAAAHVSTSKFSFEFCDIDGNACGLYLKRFFLLILIVLTSTHTQRAY